MTFNTLQTALGPLLAVWIIAKTLLDASAFVNQLRETTVLGWKDGRPLTLSHRKTLRNDWHLTMAGVLATCALFSGAMFWAARAIQLSGPAPLRSAQPSISNPTASTPTSASASAGTTETGKDAPARLADLLYVVGTFSLVGMVSFMTCGWWDHKLMQETLRSLERVEAAHGEALADARRVQNETLIRDPRDC